jgi:hypothetical protein
MNMPWYESSLTRLETRLRTLIEGAPGVDGISHKLHKKLEHELITAMRSSLKGTSAVEIVESPDLIAADVYIFVLPTQQAQLLLTHPAELDRLSEALKAAALRAGIRFVCEPVLRVVAAPPASEMKVLVEFSQAVEDSQTTEMDGISSRSGQPNAGTIPNAFLIVNGLTTYSLTEPVINLGRDPSNQVQLGDPRVSRMHAQLRLIQGKFMIFDLDSMGGTFVNNVAVSSHILNPGDVIRLAGVPLVYGVEESMPNGFTQELPVEPPAPEVL